MLTVTDTAAQAISSLVTKHKMPEGSGLRISRQGDGTRSGGLGISIAAAPAEDDTVVETKGARVFLPPNMIKILHDQELDVEFEDGEDGEEQPHFTVDRRRDARRESGPKGSHLPAHFQPSDPDLIIEALDGRKPTGD